MRKRWILSPVIMAVLAGAALHAQNMPYTIGIGCQTLIPQTPVDWRDYFNGNIGLDFHLVLLLTDRSSIAFDFVFQKIRLDQKAFLDDQPRQLGSRPVSAEGMILIDQIGIRVLRYLTDPEKRMSLYGCIGGGYYRIRPGIGVTMGRQIVIPGQPVVKDTVSLGLEQNKPSLSAGFGVEFGIGYTVLLYGEGLYHFVFTNDRNHLITGKPMNEKTTFITPMVGIRYRF